MSRDLKPAISLSVVAPCYNEELVLPEFLRRTSDACRSLCGDQFEIILVNDGSRDRTWAMIDEAARAASFVKGVDLNRNYGHQLAVSAGVSVALGSRILIIDADLQDPPELLGDMMRLMDQGYDVVYGQRRQRPGETKFKLTTARLFYRALNSMTQIEIPVDTGDFRLINRRTADLLNSMPEQQRFLRGMVAWIGGRQIPLFYDRDVRFAGETKYTLRKMVRLAIDGITAFSAAPLKLATLFAFVAGVAALLVALSALFSYVFLHPDRGWTSTILVILIFAAAQLLSLGIIGEYLGRIYMQTKGRPLFIIRDVVASEPSSVRSAQHSKIGEDGAAIPAKQ